MTGIAARARGYRNTRSFRTTVYAVLLTIGVTGAGLALAQGQSESTVENSSLDAPLFHQLLIGELEMAAGRAGNAYEVILDAARRHGDESLYQRATDIALQAHAGDQALAAARAWRTAKPPSMAAMRYETQILLALNRPDESAEPLAAWLAAVPAIERPALIANLPRLLARMPDKRQALALVERLVAPYRDAPATRDTSRMARARAQQLAGDTTQALALASEVAADDPAATAPVVLALDMLPATVPAEGLVTRYLARADAEPALRLAYVRMLTQQQRFADAVPHLEQLTRERPQLPDPWLTLGAMRLEMRQTAQAEAALKRYLELSANTADKPANKPADKPPEAASDEPETDVEGTQSGRGTTQAWLLLAQAAELRGDVKGAEAWLAKIDNPQQALDVQTRRASLLIRQGKVPAARALIHAVPERTGDDARAKLLAEAQVLRDAKLYADASKVLTVANQRFADDVDLIYEQSMVEEKLDHFADMERLLRRVIALKPDHPHAHNALGYSLADRNMRLPEARELIRQALNLSPGDPFITDSLGWVEYRLGNADEAQRLLRQAYRARPDAEISAHLGEVLWAAGQRDEARKVWVEGRGRDASNEVLRETLARLKVGL